MVCMLCLYSMLHWCIHLVWLNPCIWRHNINSTIWHWNNNTLAQHWSIDWVIDWMRILNDTQMLYNVRIYTRRWVKDIVMDFGVILGIGPNRMYTWPSATINDHICCTPNEMRSKSKARRCMQSKLNNYSVTILAQWQNKLRPKTIHKHNRQNLIRTLIFFLIKFASKMQPELLLISNRTCMTNSCTTCALSLVYKYMYSICSRLQTARHHITYAKCGWERHILIHLTKRQNARAVCRPIKQKSPLAQSASASNKQALHNRDKAAPVALAPWPLCAVIRGTEYRE